MHVRSNKTISINHRSIDEVTVCMWGKEGWGGVGGLEALGQSRVIGIFPKIRNGVHHFQVEILVSRC